MRLSMRRCAPLAAAALLLAAPIEAKTGVGGDAANATAAASAPGKWTPEMKAFAAGLHPRTGDIELPAAKAVLHLGNDYFFLPAEDARRVLVEAWGNPPGAADGVLGMVFKQGTTVFDAVWGAVLTYESTGHVSDDDAHSTDYDKLLADMQRGTEDRNAERTKAGYPAMHLVGWAQAPSYDAAAHSLVWARRLRVDGGQGDELNYDVRLLGRTGVLSMNMLASMDAIGEVRQAAGAFASAVSFQPGSTYADFNPSSDHKAEYGVAGLIAGGAAVAVAKKFGLLAVILAFGKKALILIPIALAAIVAGAKRLFGGRRDPDVM
ncbi:MAG: DUF2167 domain-containing protein [Pseudomonadota bacterium]